MTLRGLTIVEASRLPLEGLRRGIEVLEGGLEGVKKVMIVPN